MSRSISLGELNVLDQPDYKIFARLLIEGTPIEDVVGVNPLRTFSIVADLDAPVWSATFVCGILSGNQSLSPFLSTGATLSGRKIFALYRTISCEVQCTIAGSAPTLAGWRTVFEGIINDRSIQPQAGTVTLFCRDQISVLIDRQIENITTIAPIGDDPGGAKWGLPITGSLISTMLQQILTDTIGYGEPFAIVDETGATATDYWQERTTVMQALLDLGTGKDGRDIRGKWDLTGYGPNTFVLAAYLPDRAGVDFPAAIFSHFRSPGQIPYILNSAKDSVIGVKNVAEITPLDDLRVPVVTTNATSISNYGRWFLAVSEDKASHIDTPTEAGDLGTIIVGDLGQPKTAVEITVPFIWFLEINDLFLLGPDGATGYVYDGFGTFAVVHLEMRYDGQGVSTTEISGRLAGASAGSSFWREGTIQSRPKMVYIKTTDPVGPAVKGSIWIKPDDLTMATPV